MYSWVKLATKSHLKDKQIFTSQLYLKLPNLKNQLAFLSQALSRFVLISIVIEAWDGIHYQYSAIQSILNIAQYIYHDDVQYLEDIESSLVVFLIQVSPPPRKQINYPTLYSC